MSISSAKSAQTLILLQFYGHSPDLGALLDHAASPAPGAGFRVIVFRHIQYCFNTFSFPGLVLPYLCFVHYNIEICLSWFLSQIVFEFLDFVCITSIQCSCRLQTKAEHWGVSFDQLMLSGENLPP